MANEELKKILRAMVLKSRDDYSDGIKQVLNAAGYPTGWAKVSGNRLTVYLCGSEIEPNAFMRKLIDDIGGSIGLAYQQRDDYYQWTWEAPIDG